MIKEDFRNKIIQIKTWYHLIESEYERLPENLKYEIFEFHCKDYGLPHCIRWGVQAAGDILKNFDKIYANANKKYRH